MRETGAPSLTLVTHRPSLLRPLRESLCSVPYLQIPTRNNKEPMIIG